MNNDYNVIGGKIEDFKARANNAKDNFLKFRKKIGDTLDTYWIELTKLLNHREMLDECGTWLMENKIQIDKFPTGFSDFPQFCELEETREVFSDRLRDISVKLEDQTLELNCQWLVLESDVKAQTTSLKDFYKDVDSLFKDKVLTGLSTKILSLLDSVNKELKDRQKDLKSTSQSKSNSNSLRPPQKLGNGKRTTLASTSTSGKGKGSDPIVCSTHACQSSSSVDLTTSSPAASQTHDTSPAASQTRDTDAYAIDEGEDGDFDFNVETVGDETVSDSEEEVQYTDECDEQLLVKDWKKDVRNYDLALDFEVQMESGREYLTHNHIPVASRMLGIDQVISNENNDSEEDQEVLTFNERQVVVADDTSTSSNERLNHIENIFNSPSSRLMYDDRFKAASDETGSIKRRHIEEEEEYDPNERQQKMSRKKKKKATKGKKGSKNFVFGDMDMGVSDALPRERQSGNSKKDRQALSSLSIKRQLEKDHVIDLV